MQMANQDTPIGVQWSLNHAVRRLRARLILEEALETIQGLGFHVPVGEISEHEKGFDLVAVADGCADLSVVNTGTLIACGVPDESLLQLVDSNNIAKFSSPTCVCGGSTNKINDFWICDTCFKALPLEAGPHLRADGKLVKGTGHKAPDIEGFLKALA